MMVLEASFYLGIMKLMEAWLIELFIKCKKKRITPRSCFFCFFVYFVHLVGFWFMVLFWFRGLF
jgi:hypothetical protein